MSDINTYANEAAITDLSNPINGDLVLNQGNNSVYLCTNAELTGLDRWKKFANAAEAAVYQNRYALDLDGSNGYIDCGGNTDFSFTDGSGNDSAFSVSAWVKLDSSGTVRVAAKGNMEWLFGTDSSSRFNIILWSEDWHSAYLQRFSTSLSTNVWHNIAATYDGSNLASGIKLYKAGNEVSSTDGSTGTYAGMAFEQGSLRIGSWEFNNSAMNGLVAEVAVFDYELTSPQVESLSSADNLKPVDISTLSITQPIGWYRMGDDSNDSPVDADNVTGITNTANPGTNDATTAANSQPTFSALASSETIYV